MKCIDVGPICPWPTMSTLGRPSACLAHAVAVWLAPRPLPQSALIAHIPQCGAVATVDCAQPTDAAIASVRHHARDMSSGTPAPAGERRRSEGAVVVGTPTRRRASCRRHRRPGRASMASGTADDARTRTGSGRPTGSASAAVVAGAGSAAATLDRRVRASWDALQTGAFEQAVQLADKALAKHPASAVVVDQLKVPPRAPWVH